MRLSSSLLAIALIAPAAAEAQTASPFTSYTLTGTSYSQNFDSLANGSGTSQSLPAGFQIVENGSSSAVDGAYVAGTGSGNGGNAYSFGAAGSSERALGSLTSGTNSPIMLGGVFTNGLGSTITSITLNYFGEQWRAGDAGADSLAFEYSTDATNLLNGTWTRLSALDFAALVTNAATAGALDGNAAANRQAIGATINGLSIAAGRNFGFRWTDVDVTGADHGLAIDDMTLSARTAAAAVPEPATWAMMIAGFGLVGAGLRRRRAMFAAA